MPPLNEVAFPAYARIQDDLPALRAAFLKAVRLIMLVTCPLYFGLAVVAQDAVDLVLGEKWRAMAPLVAILAFGMPMFTLYSLFGPAVTALGRTGITMRSAMFGAMAMPLAFLFASSGARSGSPGPGCWPSRWFRSRPSCSRADRSG